MRKNPGRAKASHLGDNTGRNINGPRNKEIINILWKKGPDSAGRTIGAVPGTDWANPKYNVPSAVSKNMMTERAVSVTSLSLWIPDLRERKTMYSSMRAKARGKMLYGNLTIPERRKRRNERR